MEQNRRRKTRMFCDIAPLAYDLGSEFHRCRTMVLMAGGSRSGWRGFIFKMNSACLSRHPAQRAMTFFALAMNFEHQAVLGWASRAGLRRDGADLSGNL